MYISGYKTPSLGRYYVESMIIIGILGTYVCIQTSEALADVNLTFHDEFIIFVSYILDTRYLLFYTYLYILCSWLLHNMCMFFVE